MLFFKNKVDSRHKYFFIIPEFFEFLNRKENLMRLFYVLFIFIFLMLSCSTQSTEKVKPLDRTNMDLTVKPGDNFYEYANGTWLKNNPIPPDYSRWGAFEILREQNWKDLETIFVEAATRKDAEPGSKWQKIGDFYATGMDTAKINEEGTKPLADLFKRIDDIKTTADVQEVIANFHSQGITPSFFLFSEQDQKNSNMVITWLYQGGLGLPDRDYYVKDDSRSKEIREAYLKHVTNMFKLMGDPEGTAEKNAQTVMNMETELAKASRTRLEMRNPKLNYNKMTLAELEHTAPYFDWASYFDRVGLGDPGDINVGQPDFFKETSKMMKTISVNDWKTYLRWHLIDETAQYLSKDLLNEDFDFNGKFLSGTQELLPRWKRVLNTTSTNLGELVGQLYVERYFPPESKKRMVDLVMNLKTALGERIKNVDWMSEETKEKALAKLEAFGVKIGYPDKWIDYSSLEIKRDSYVLNVIRANAFETRRDLNKIGKPVDPTEWGMTPQTVNAYYHPFRNEVVFPAGILQPPFFNPNADDPVNYGAIGVVIGHEMTHGFDDQGRQYDAEGNLNDWWTPEDAKRFDERAQVLVDQFNQYFPVDTVHIDGKLTLGENIADLGGLNVSYDALQHAMAKNPPKAEIDGFTPDQRFFLGYAQVWRNNIRKENLLLRLKTDVHSPGKYRVIGPLSDLPTFYAAFDVKEGDAMWRPEDKRAKIW